MKNCKLSQNTQLVNYSSLQCTQKWVVVVKKPQTNPYILLDVRLEWVTTLTQHIIHSSRVSHFFRCYQFHPLQENVILITNHICRINTLQLLCLLFYGSQFFHEFWTFNLYVAKLFTIMTFDYTRVFWLNF
jgi:hypothetical protein